ncbi:MAG: FliI/YscN family ATPase [Brevinema sp.]
MNEIFAKYQNALDRSQPLKAYGKILGVNGLMIEADGPTGSIGDLCIIHAATPIKAEIAGFRDRKTLLMPLGHLSGIAPGMKIENTLRPILAPCGDELLGRVLSGIGEPLDGNGAVQVSDYYPLDNPPPNPYQRKRIDDIMVTGVRAIDGILSAGGGQRLGIFAGSGVGKSTLLGMIARNTEADVNVIALIGERGREVKEFIENDLGPEGLARSVIIAVTGDEPPLLRLRGAYTATSIAEYFRSQGKNVMFMMDSVTRFAMAQREVGLSLGEPPALRGYTPSVFSTLQKLLERTGNDDKASITAFYTVLVEGDDGNEPISDTARGILDGHIVLSRTLAEKGHFPAIDINASISRSMKDIADERHLSMAARLKDMMAVYKENEDIINIGAYIRGGNPTLDEAIIKMDMINAYLRQGITEKSTFDQTILYLHDLVDNQTKHHQRR